MMQNLGSVFARSRLSILTRIFFFVVAAFDLTMPQEKYVPAGADGRFDLWYKPRKAVNGATPSEARQISTKAERVAEYLRTIPAVKNPPAPHCTRVYYLVEQGSGGNNDNKMIAGSLGVTLPEFFDKKKNRGSSITASGVSMRFNDRTAIPLTAVKGPNEGETLSDARGEALYFLSPVVEKSGRVTRFKNGTMLITRDATPVIVPVSKERYLKMLERQWLALIAKEKERAREVLAHNSYATWLSEKPKRKAAQEQALKVNASYMTPAQLEQLKLSFETSERENEAVLRKLQEEMPKQKEQMEAALRNLEARLEKVRTELRTLTLAQLQSPACVADNFSTSALNNETAGPMDNDEMKWIYNYNPNYFGRSGSKANLEMLTAQCSQRREMIESQERFELRMKIYHSIDWAKLATFLD